MGCFFRIVFFIFAALFILILIDKLCGATMSTVSIYRELPTYAETGGDPVNNVDHSIDHLRKLAVSAIRGDCHESQIPIQQVDAIEAFQRLRQMVASEPDLVVADYLEQITVPEYEKFAREWQSHA